MNRLNVLLLWGVAMTAAAAPGNDDMARCAAIAAADSRLACYDALAHRPADKTARAAAPTSAPVSASTPVAAGPAPAPAARATTAAAQAPAAPLPNPADPNNFGLSAKQQHTADLGPKSIRAQISMVSSGQVGQTTVVLDNGQSWAVMDNDGRLSSGDAVTIKRAALGSFLMMTPSNHSYRVRRIK